MATWRHDGIDFHFRQIGSGIPFVFQHGLGGDVSQPLALVKPRAGLRLLTMDFRAHGETTPVGPAQGLDIKQFANDIAAWLDSLSINRAIIGGTSMGAAVAIAFRLAYPERTLGLVINRPAWLDSGSPANLAVFAEIADLLTRYDPSEGARRFRQSDTYQSLAINAPDNAAVLLAVFGMPRAQETAIKFQMIPQSAPLDDLRLLAQIDVPALVLVNQKDPLHPKEYGERYAQALPNAELCEVTSKSMDIAQHHREVDACVGAWLERHFGVGDTDAAAHSE